MRESDLKAFWASRFSLREYRAETGERVLVKFPGFRSEGAGPDFTGAIAEFEGIERKGDVEVHRRRGDWRAHGHHADPRYDDVLLHVVLHAEGPEALTRSGRRVPTVSLLRNLGGLLERLIERAKEEARRPCPFLPPLPALAEVLDKLGTERLKRKASRFKAEIEAGRDPEQVLYEGLAEALGYLGNRRPMLELARTLPFSEARTARNPLELSRRMLDVASKIHGWKIWGIRPPNFPLPRIRGLAALVGRFSDRGFVEPLLGALESPGEIVNMLCVKGLVGAGRARAIVVNVVIPFALALRPDWGEKVLEAWRSALPEPDNRLLRRMRRKLFDHIEGGNRLLREARFRQGALELYHRYCFLPACETCPIKAAG